MIEIKWWHKYNTNVLKNQQGENIKICNLYSGDLYFRIIWRSKCYLSVISALNFFFFFWQVIWWSWRGPKGAIPHFSFQRPLPFSVSIERHSPWQWNPPFEVGDWQINSGLEGRFDINRYVKLWLHFEVISIAHCWKTCRKWLKTKTCVLIYNN